MSKSYRFFIEETRTYHAWVTAPDNETAEASINEGRADEVIRLSITFKVRQLKRSEDGQEES